MIESTEIKILHQLVNSRAIYRRMMDRCITEKLFIERDSQPGVNTHKLLFTIATHYFYQYENTPSVTRDGLIRYVSIMHLSDEMCSNVLNIFDIAMMSQDSSPIDELIDFLKSTYEKDNFQSILIDGSKYFNDNKIKEGIGSLRKKLFSLDMATSEYTSGVSLSEDIDGRLQDALIKKPNGVMSGFATFDRATRGLRGGQLMIVASGTGEGKTPYCYNFGLNAWRSGSNILIISIENYKRDVLRCIDSAATGISHNNLQEGGICAFDQSLMKGWIGECKKRTNILRVEERLTDCTPEFLESKISEILPAKYDLVIVDYLQLMTLGNVSANKDQLNMYYGELVQQVRAIAKKHNVPILTPSQINRTGKQSKDPKGSDMYDSYSDAFSQIISNTADIRLSLKAVDPNMYYDSAGIVELNAVFTKHRGGPRPKFVIKADFARMKMIEDVGPKRETIDNFGPEDIKNELPGIGSEEN